MTPENGTLLIWVRRAGGEPCQLETLEWEIFPRNSKPSHRESISFVRAKSMTVP